MLVAKISQSNPNYKNTTFKSLDVTHSIPKTVVPEIVKPKVKSVDIGVCTSAVVDEVAKKVLQYRIMINYETTLLLNKVKGKLIPAFSGEEMDMKDLLLTPEGYYSECIDIAKKAIDEGKLKNIDIEI